MNVLVITNLFPNSQELGRGLFNLQPLQLMRDTQDVDIKVVAPLPWAPPFPGIATYKQLRRVPHQEEVYSFEVFHPRYLVIPKLGRNTHAATFYLGIRKTVKKIYQEWPVDVILATWAYPDACGAARIAAELGVPLVIKTHGSDINAHIQDAGRRNKIKQAMEVAHKVIAVSPPLVEKIVSLPFPREKVECLSNGVDQERFYPRNKSACREDLNLPRESLHFLFVGHLKPVKGVGPLLEAFARFHDQLENAQLIYVGDGELRQMLELRVKALGLEGHVLFAGSRPHGEIAQWMGACDVLCLPSLMEGCPNVILEALASGRPVLASHTGGIPDLLTDPQWSVTVEPGDVDALTEGFTRIAAMDPNPANIVAGAPLMSWKENVKRLHKTLQDAAAFGLKD